MTDDRNARTAIQAATTAAVAAAVFAAVPVARSVLLYDAELGAMSWVLGVAVPMLMLGLAVGVFRASTAAAAAAVGLYSVQKGLSVVHLVLVVGEQWVSLLDPGRVLLDLALAVALLGGVWGARRLDHLQRNADLEAQLDALAGGDAPGEGAWRSEGATRHRGG